MKKISFLLFLFLPLGLFAQGEKMMTKDSTSVVKKETFTKVSPQLLKKEAELQELFNQILKKDTRDSERIAINDQIFEKLGKVLKDSGSFTHPFDSLKNLGKIYSDDYSIRVYTWCCEMEDMSYRFWGYIHDLDNEAIYPLIQSGPVYIPIENQAIMLKRWYGALYYKAIKVSKKNQDPKYILLGWSQPNLRTKMKIMEVLDIQPDDHKVLLGSKIFKGYRGKALRSVFTYCSDLSISLNYNEKDKEFIFDHLTPLSDDQGNSRGCNGPDMSYDSLKKSKRWFFNKGTWKLKKDVDVRNKQ